MYSRNITKERKEHNNGQRNLQTRADGKRGYDRADAPRLVRISDQEQLGTQHEGSVAALVDEHSKINTRTQSTIMVGRKRRITMFTAAIEGLHETYEYRQASVLRKLWMDFITTVFLSILFLSLLYSVYLALSGLVYLATGV